METLYNILLISTSAIGLYVSVVLFFFSKHNQLLNRLLGAFAFTKAIFYILVYCAKDHLATDYVALIRTFTPLYYFTPALCYLYFRSYIQDEVNLEWKDGIHLVPFLLHLTYISPLLYALLSGQMQASELLAKVNKPTYFINFGPVPDVIHVFFRLGLMLTYLFLGLRLYLGKHFNAFTSLNRDSFPLAIKWIRYFSWVILCNAVFSLLKELEIFFKNEPGALYFGSMLSMAQLLSFVFLFIYAVFNPVILFGMPHFTRYYHPAEPSSQRVLHPQSFGILRMVQPMSEAEGTANAPDRYEVSIDESVTETMDLFKQEELTSVKEQTEKEVEETDAMLQLIQRLEAYMIEKQPFRQKEFNTFTISRELDVPQHHIAYLFKYILKKSVVDYRNQWRVNYVIDCLKQGRHNQYTIETIGLDAGYNSKSTFFLDFKKHTGKTPLQYVEEIGE